jgi:O-antigen ligase
MFAGGTTTGSAGKRVDFYRATLNAIPNQPLLGTGIGSWSKFYYGSDQRNYPHDLLREIAFEEGLIGLAAYLAVLGLAAISIVRMIGDSRSHFLVLGLLVLYCVIVSLFSGDLDDNRVLWLWMGVALSVCRLVQVRMSAIRSMEYSARRASAEAFRPVGAPAFSHQPAAERNP